MARRIHSESALLLLFCVSQLTFLADGFSLAPSASQLRSRLPSLRSQRHGLCATSMVLSREATETAESPQKGGMTVPGGTEAELEPRRSSKPPVGIIDLLTKYAWGQQKPNIPLPINVVEGQPPEPQNVVTQEHLDTLREDGVVHVKGVLSKEWIEYLRANTEWQIEHPHIWAVPGVASGLYDYIQRSAWTTNEGFANFLYYSPAASVLGKMAECGWFPEGDERGYHEIRVSTDLLMVNPNKGFKWHQDNQNGPLTSGHGGKLDALRFWVTMDDTPAEYGAPVYLRKSHNNNYVGKDEVFVSLEDGDLPKYADDVVEFRPKAGDMLIWHPRSIHKVDGAPGGDWQGKKRRVLGGTVAIDDAHYQGKKKALFSDMGSHNLQQGDPLRSPFFPIIFPRSDPEERKWRAEGRVGRSMEGFGRMVRSLFTTENFSQFSSWTQVVASAQKVASVNEPFLKDRKE
eukprot:CAMPEP_0196722726 /NCGR_PEP_ID=MMETSP1091-20130531/5001_1 /TAXON_ID=302021 /ORGANISM="Rhodomonas sp., Strain CCMP768" /LENGTH=458 /DNA_ID=CAMNT_0042064485 /DNA_START=188 /DNA_END=1564 /DNA_ORIENTATION=+